MLSRFVLIPLCLALLAGCAPVFNAVEDPLLPKMVQAQSAKNYDAIIAQQGEVREVCTADAQQCPQVRAILGHACFANASSETSVTAETPLLNCAVDELSAALTQGLPPTVGGMSQAAYRATLLEARSRRIGLARSFTQAEPDRAALAAEAAAFEADFPQDWRGYYYGGQAELQRANSLSASAPAEACAAYAEAANDYRAAVARSDTEQTRRSLAAVEPRVAACSGGATQ